MFNVCPEWLSKANHISANADSVGDGEHDANGASYSGSESPGDDVVDAAPWYLAVAGDGWEGEGGEPGDDVTQGDHQQALPDARLANDPGQSEEEHGAPDIEETSQQYSLHPTELDHLPLPGVHLLLLRLPLHRLPRHQLRQSWPAGEK